MKNRLSKNKRFLKDRTRKEQVRLNARLNRQSKDEGGSVAVRFIALVVVFLVGIAMMFAHKYFTEGITVVDNGAVDEAVYEIKTPYFALTEAELAQYQDYTIQSGDSLWRLQTDFQIKVADIKAINKMSDDNIVVGQKIKLPIRKP